MWLLPNPLIGWAIASKKIRYSLEEEEGLVVLFYGHFFAGLVIILTWCARLLSEARAVDAPLPAVILPERCYIFKVSISAAKPLFHPFFFFYGSLLEQQLFSFPKSINIYIYMYGRIVIGDAESFLLPPARDLILLHTPRHSNTWAMIYSARCSLQQVSSGSHYRRLLASTSLYRLICCRRHQQNHSITHGDHSNSMSSPSCSPIICIYISSSTYRESLIYKCRALQYYMYTAGDDIVGCFFFSCSWKFIKTKEMRGRGPKFFSGLI